MIKTIQSPLMEEKPKRKITCDARWVRMTSAESLDILRDFSSIHSELVRSQISKKIAGYKSQDTAKGLYDAALFVTLGSVIQLLTDCALKCHYCDKETQLLYDNVREPLQWSLDRIHNDQGHNTGNVCIACLECNLKRKTIHHERFMRGKQMKWNKLTE